MAKLIIFKNPYDTEAAVNNVFSYVSDNSKSNGLAGAQNMLTTDLVQQINAVGKFFYSHTRKKVLHFVISFSEIDCISPVEAFYEAQRVCGLLEEYQIAFCVHQNTDNLHIHFALSPISLADGHKFYFDKTNLYNVIKGIREVFSSYGIHCDYVFSDTSDSSIVSGI